MTRSNPEHRYLQPVQLLATSGARSAEVFHLDGELHVAIAQLAVDIPGQTAQMNAGDSDIAALIYRWRDGRLVEHESLPLSGGEDVEHFTIGARHFLATAGIRSGKGPYELDCTTVVYEHTGGQWMPFQSFPTFAAKQWRFFSIGERHFLALAQGVTVDGIVPKHARHSCLFEWDGKQFEPFQTLPGLWGYNWDFVTFEGTHYLTYADHVSGSSILRWNGTLFEDFQIFSENGGRAFRFFEDQGQLYMIHANLMKGTAVYRLSGDSFVHHQELGAAGGRELCLFRGERGLYLVRVCFITGTPHAPTTALTSQIFCWQHGEFELREEFPTSGGTDAATFVVDGQRYLVVTNSLSAEIRFQVDSVLYKFSG